MNGCHKTITYVCVLSVRPHCHPQSGRDKMLEHISMNVNLIGLAWPDVRDKQDKMHINLRCKWNAFNIVTISKVILRQ